MESRLSEKSVLLREQMVLFNPEHTCLCLFNPEHTCLYFFNPEHTCLCLFNPEHTCLCLSCLLMGPALGVVEQLL